MNYVSKFLSNVKEFYNEINSATLTGAIDVVIVQQEDGTYSCSPFHVRFGKIGVLRSREKVVDIEINGSPVNIHMKLGETGEAFFVEETEESTEVPSHLATSPIPSYDIGEEIAKLNKQVNSQNLEDTGQELERTGYVHTSVSMSAANPQAPSSLYLTSSMSKASYNIVPSESDTVYTAMSIMSVQDRGKNGTNEAALNTRNSHSVEQSSNPELIGTSRLSSSDSALPTDKVYQNDALKNSLQLNISKYMVTSQDEVDNVMFHSAADSDLHTTLNSSQVNQNVITDDDKLKMRKKRRKRSIIRKRKGREVSQNSSDEDSPEEIFQMDVDDVEETSHSAAVSTTSLLNRTVIPTTISDKISDGSTSYSLPDRFKSTVNCNEEISESSQHVNMDAHHNWQHKNNMPLNLDFHPFSDGDVTPILSPVTSRPPTPKSDTEYEIQKQESASQRETGENRWSWTWGELPVPPKGPVEMPKEEPLSDDETIKSKNLQKEEEEQRSMLGGMFRFMRKTKKLRHQPESEGIYLDDLNFDELDPEIAKLYFPPRNTGFHSHATPAIQTPGQMKDEDVESGNGSSLPQSPHSVEGAIGSLHGIDSDCEDRNSVFDFKGYNDMAMSLCGGLAEFDSEIPQERFLHSLITYDDFTENPSLLNNPDLVVRFNNKYYNWNTVAPMVMSLINFQRPLPEKTVTDLVKDNMPKKPKKSETKSYSWFYWRRSTTPQEEDAKKTKEIKKEDSTDASREDPAGTGLSIDDGKLTEVKVEPVEPKAEVKEAAQLTTEVDHKTDESHPQPELPVSTCQSLPPAVATTPTAEAETPEFPTAKQIEGISPSQSDISSPPSSPMQKTLSTSVNDDDSTNEMSPQLPPSEGSFTEEIKPGIKERYKKTLRLSSEQIAELNLKEGPNEVMFSVTTAYQGTTRCKCHIYLWKYDDKIVISDIDGTITKSDVLGHILPIIGKDWAQSGVAQLFTKIKNNGYQFLYLSARAIGQAHITREYLKSIRQGDVCLPDGPLLLNPSSLITAFHREVIEKKPEEFKISCLRDIQALFPSSRNPFYAGYGNKINDVWAYRAVGIPISRIFTINHKGELKHELTQTFQSSYSGLSYVVDHVFPPLRRSNERDGPLLSDFEGSDEFSSFTYWRPPIPEIQIEIPVHSGTPTDEKKKEEKK